MSAAEPLDDATELAQQVLDGAVRAFSRFGVRACTIEQIAREAGVSRITVYRHVGPKSEIFRQVVLRNTRSYFGELEKEFAQARVLDDVVRAVFSQARLNYVANELYRTLLELEPETVLRMLTTDARSHYEQGVPFLEPFLGRFLLPGADAREAAEWIVRQAISVVGTAGYLLEPADDEALERLVSFTVRGLPVRVRPRRRPGGSGAA